MILSSMALAASLSVSAIKFVGWLAHTDVRALIRTGRWLLVVLALAAVPCLIALLFFQQWELAMMLGAGVLIVLARLNWRTILPRTTFRPAWTGDASDGAHGDWGPPRPDAELARRAAIVLEDYLIHARRSDGRAYIDSGQPAVLEHGASRSDAPMDVNEALEVLGLQAGATTTVVRAAHRRLVQLVHPDRSGSNYLAAKINRAKDVLLDEAARKPRAPSKRTARKEE